MYKNSALLSLILSFSLIAATAQPAQAVDGPGDALALVTTATLAVTSAFSAYCWYHAKNPEFILNELALEEGKDGWAAAFLANAKYITLASGVTSALMMAKFCTHTGIAAVDDWLGLPRN